MKLPNKSGDGSLLTCPIVTMSHLKARIFICAADPSLVLVRHRFTVSELTGQLSQEQLEPQLQTLEEAQPQLPIVSVVFEVWTWNCVLD